MVKIRIQSPEHSLITQLKKKSPLDRYNLIHSRPPYQQNTFSTALKHLMKLGIVKFEKKNRYYLTDAEYQLVKKEDYISSEGEVKIDKLTPDVQDFLRTVYLVRLLSIVDFHLQKLESPVSKFLCKRMVSEYGSH